jgi:tetratricopeptide (TPR) repeat protein
MKSGKIFIYTFSMAVILGMLSSIPAFSKEVIRPEEVKSKRQVIYDDASYKKLDSLWQEYYKEYPSEYAYANWMYAARYAGDKNYSKLLDKGVEKYPANPTLLYLKGLQYCHMEQEPKGMEYFEKAVALDPNYGDPWFGLVTYFMESREYDKLDNALKRLLESGDITEEIMDYNYNVLIGLEKNAIIFTNGDNDTYPIWILIRVLHVRPDVTIVNRSLLNTSWYPIYVIEQGLPRFIGSGELEKLRSDLDKNKKSDTYSPGGRYGDTLILRIIESAKIAGRPAYLAKTMYTSKQLKPLVEAGRDIGLAWLVTPSKMDKSELYHRVYNIWLKDFRTEGISGWRLLHLPESAAGNFIIPNYAYGIASNLEALKKYAPDLRLKLFEWYNKYIERLLSEDNKYKMAYVWSCYASDVGEINKWCQEQGVKCGESDKK